MQRSLLLLLAGLLAMAAPSSAIYVEGYVRDEWHDLVFDVNQTDDGIGLVLVDGNFSEIQSSDHVNYTVRNNLDVPVQFVFESTQHGDDPVDDQGNVQKTTRPLDAVDIPAGTQVNGAVVLYNDSFAIRFTAVAGDERSEIETELMNMYIMAMTGGLEEDGALDDGNEQLDDEHEDKRDTPFLPMLGVAAVALLGAALLRRRA